MIRWLEKEKPKVAAKASSKECSPSRLQPDKMASDRLEHRLQEESSMEMAKESYSDTGPEEGNLGNFE